MAFGGDHNPYNFLGGDVLKEKTEKIEKMLEKASDDLSKAQSANETIYRRAFKEALTQVLLVLKEK